MHLVRVRVRVRVIVGLGLGLGLVLVSVLGLVLGLPGCPEAPLGIPHDKSQPVAGEVTHFPIWGRE